MKKITKIFTSVLVLLLVCVGAFGLSGCQKGNDNDDNQVIPTTVVYGQEFTILTNSVKTCKFSTSGNFLISMDFQVSISNTTDVEYQLNQQVLVLSWDDNMLTKNGNTYFQFVSDSDNYTPILPHAIKITNWTNGMNFVYTDLSIWEQSKNDYRVITNILKNISFTLKYNGVQIATFKMDVSNMEIQK